MADKEKNSIELTDFEKAVGVTIGTWNPKTDEQIQSVKAVANKLLNYARKELQKEFVSDDLEEEIKRYCNKNGYTCTDDGVVYTLNEQIVNTARHFSEWQKQQMMKDGLDYRVQVNGMSERYIVIHNPIINDNTLNEGDHVKFIIIKDDQI